MTRTCGHLRVKGQAAAGQQPSGGVKPACLRDVERRVLPFDTMNGHGNLTTNLTIPRRREDP